MVLFTVTCATAETKHIRYSNDEQDYDFQYDSARLSGYDVNQVVWLSPYYRPYGPGLFEVGSGEDAPGRPRKQIMMLPLEYKPHPIAAKELSEHKPGPEPGEPGSPAYWAYLTRNLDFGRHELVLLRGMKLPPVLEPVRKFMLGFLQRDVRMQEARYEYARTGDAEPLRTLLCSHCGCGKGEADQLIAPLRAASDVRTRLQATFFDWTNKMLHCVPDQWYPLEAWNRFLSDFGIRESNREKGPE